MSLLESAPRVAGLIEHLPPDVHSLAAADEAAELYAAYRHPLDDEQRRTLDAALGERADGTWAAAEVGDFKARQAGKNDTVECRELAGLELFGETLQLHTAHEFPTANEAFLRMAGLYENYDDLRRNVARIRYANGEQGVELKSGARLKYKARTGGAGRGFAEADLIVLDEGQHLRPEHLAAIAPTITANPNAQIWTCGSGALEHSAVAWKLRRRALSGDGGRLGYTERTAEIVGDDGSLYAPDIVDPLDHDLLMRAHPGYAAGRTSREILETLLKSMGFDLFIRECLCIWMPEPDDGATGPIDVVRWGSLSNLTELAEPGSVRLALDAPPDRMSASFALAGTLASGLAHVQVREHVPPSGMGNLVALAKTLTDGHDTPLIIPPGSPVLAWKAELVSAGVPLDLLTPAEYAEACGAMSAKVAEGALSQRPSRELDEAVAGLSARTSGDVEVWSRRSSQVNIAPFVAATCALVRVPAKQAAVPLGAWR